MDTHYLTKFYESSLASDLFCASISMQNQQKDISVNESDAAVLFSFSTEFFATVFLTEKFSWTSLSPKVAT